MDSTPCTSQPRTATSTCYYAIDNQDLTTAQHFVLLGAHIRPVDFPASHIEIRQQLMAWADDHLTRHRTFVSTVLPAIHDDGSHSAVNQTNWLTHLAGLRELRVRVAEYLGIRDGAEHAALVGASGAFIKMAAQERRLASERRRLAWSLNRTYRKN